MLRRSALGHEPYVRAVIPPLGELLRHHREDVIAAEDPTTPATVPAPST